jgi:N,N'-diacetyllegionaminate synthase
MDFNKNWIIAEIGSVHDGSFGNACKLIEAAANAGANCVKFQTHIAEAETLANAPAPSYFKTEPRLEYFRRTGFTLDQWRELKKVCEENNVEFISSPFSLEAVDLLEEVGVGAYKIPSGEVSNIPLLEKLNKINKPIILSSGMSSWEEIDLAVNALSDVESLCVMQCTSEYPCQPENIGLNILDEIRNRYPRVTIGYSDHTLGFGAPVAAVALGATMVEKHFTFSKLMYGSDAAHSMEPISFRALCDSLEEVWKALKNPVDKNAIDKFQTMKMTFEKSIVTSMDIEEGTCLTKNHFAFKKPGDGIPARDYVKLIGKITNKNLSKDHKLEYSDFL